MKRKKIYSKYYLLTKYVGRYGYNDSDNKLLNYSTHSTKVVSLEHSTIHININLVQKSKTCHRTKCLLESFAVNTQFNIKKMPHYIFNTISIFRYYMCCIHVIQKGSILSSTQVSKTWRKKSLWRTSDILHFLNSEA